MKELHKVQDDAGRSAAPLLDGRVALITGGTSGIGEASARALASAGAHVIISGRRAEVGEQIVSSIASDGGSAHFIECDLSDPSDTKQLVQKSLAKWSRLDIAFNNAGVLGSPRLISDETIENYDVVFNTNVRGTLLCMKYEMALFMEQGHGVIVNNTSVYGTVGFAQCASYVAAKHAIEGLTKVAALEGAPKGVRVNAVAPGFTRTSVRSHLGEDENLDQHMAGLHPLGRMGEPWEVAAAVVFLASDSASFVTGVSLPVDGGYLAQ